jgi:pimeloyl-ACP methyl ester carboxylesterase
MTKRRQFLVGLIVLGRSSFTTSSVRGKSDHPANPPLWRTERFVDELPRLRAALGLNDVHVLGHSWGSMLAVDYMLMKPTGVRSLVLASPCLSVTRWLSDAETLKKTLPEAHRPRSKRTNGHLRTMHQIIRRR